MSIENDNPDVEAGAPSGQSASGPVSTTVTGAGDPPAPLPIGSVADILGAPSDLVEEVIAVPQWGCSIRIKSLTASQSARVRGASIDMSTGKPVMDWEALEKTQFLHGVVDPKFKAPEVNQLHHQSGPGFASVIAALDRISGTSKKAVKETVDSFQTSGGDGPATD